MLNYFICFILHMFLSTTTSMDSLEYNMQSYLKKKMEYVNQELNIDISSEAFRSKRDVHKSSGFLSHEYIKFDNITSFHLLNLFNRSYIFDGSLYEIIPGENAFLLDRVSNFTILVEDEIDFIRSIYYNNIEFISICLKSGISNIYLLKNINEISPVQYIKHPEGIQDSKFFINDGKIYLITTSNLGVSLSVTLIYEWQGTYFDKITDTFSQNTNFVFTFSSGKSEIIAILQKSTVAGKSPVYQFRNNRMRKIQLLGTTDPYHMTKYTFNNHIYLIILNKDQANLYKWNGLELHIIGNYPIQEDVETTHLSYISNIPLLFVLTKKDVLLYNPAENFELLSNSTLENKFQVIYVAQTMEFVNKYFLYFFAKAEESFMELHSLEFAIQSTETDNKIYVKEPLSSCMSNLEKKLENDQEQLNAIKDNNADTAPVVEKATEHQILNKTSSILQQSNIVKEIENDITRKYLKVLDILEKIKPEVLNLFQPSIGIFDGRVNMFGGLQSTTLKANRIEIEELNSNKWEPDKWLTYNTDQIITGEIKMKHLAVDNITTPKSLFEDALLLSGNQKLSGPITFKSLQSTKLYTNSINDIVLTDLFLKGNPIRINGVKSFNTLKSDTLYIDYINEKNASDILKYFTDGYHFNSSTSITNLEVENINGIHWNKFKDSIFRSGLTNRITGDLVIKNLTVKALNLQSLNNIEPQNILTTVTDQKIKSKITFILINSENINCSDINGVNLDKDVVKLTDSNKIVTGAVTVNNMLIQKNIHMNSTKSNEFASKFGTKGNNFQQIYKKVKIIGNARMENLYFQPNSVLRINGKEFNLHEIPNKFWLKHTDQSIPVHIKILHGVTIPRLVAASINGIKIDDYMTNDLANRSATSYVFREVIVLGNITINDNVRHFPNLIELNENSVKLTGSYDIYGKKTFKGNLTVNQANVNYLNDINAKEVLTIDSREILGEKQFEYLVVKGNLTAKQAYIYNLNGIELDSINNRFITTDRIVHLESLKMKDIAADKIETVLLNNRNLNKYILNLDNLHAIDILDRVEVVGDIIARDLINLTQLNDIHFDLIAEKLAGDPIMAGTVKFPNNVVIENLLVARINNIYLPDLMDNLMHKQFQNRIKSRPKFKILRTPSLICDYINNLDMRDIIDVKDKNPQTLPLRNKLILKAPTFTKSLSGDLACNIEEIVKSIQNPPTRYWSTIKIMKNATIEEKEHVLSSMLEHAVTIGRNNFITAPVTFSRVSAKHVYSKRHVNNIDIDEIYKDALLKTNRDELITGNKIFNKLTTAGVTVYGDAVIPTINKLSIQEIDRSIIHKEQISELLIKGHKTFNEGLHTRILDTKEILNMDPQNIVNLDDLKPIPYASFDTLHVLYNLEILNVNGNNFTQFLENRMLKNTDTQQILTGIYYFDNIHINAESHIPAINKINLSEVIFDVGIQNIPVLKEFTQDVIIYRDVEITELNRMNITEKYENAMLIDKETKINNIVFEGITRANNISTKNLNGIPVESIKAMLQSKTPKIKASIIRDTVSTIRNINELNSKNAENLPTQYMYLDKYIDFDIPVPNAVDAQAIETKGHVIIHVLSEEGGYACNLPLNCSCPIQKMIQITHEFSIHLFTSKGNQRIFSYENDLLTIHVLTDSISYSNECRNLNTSSLTEYTTLTWINKITGHSFAYNDEAMNGYIGNAEFFSYGDYIYIILNKLHDIRTDTSNSYCLVLKLYTLKNTVEIIQKITTSPLAITSVFRTAQNVNLIIGNAFGFEKLSSTGGTGFYKFDFQTEEFFLLREINGIECVSATSVVLGAESFIFLGQKDNHISIWKYNQRHENYYFYQDLILDSPIASISTFYTNDFTKTNDAFISAVTQRENFYIYDFRYVEGWKLLSQGELQGLRLLTPFNLNGQTYLFAPFARISSLLTPVKHGQN